MTGISSATLPQELIDEIIDNFRNDYETLKCCAITSRSFLGPSQRNLFWSVGLSSSKRSSGIHGLLRDTPHIARYIHRFHIYDISSCDSDDADLPALLRLLISLEDFSVIALYHFEWKWISEATRDAILSLVALPSLAWLCISCLLGVPTSIFAPQKKLSWLGLYHTTFDDTPETNVSGVTATSIALSLYNSDSVYNADSGKEDSLHILMRRCALFSHIKSLTMDVPIRPTMSLICSLIQASTQSVETVVFKGMFNNLRGHQDWFTFDFNTSPNFNRLAFHLSVDYHSRAIPELCQLLDFMSANPSTASVPVFRIAFDVPGVVALDLVEINAEGFDGFHDMIAESAVWAQLDHILHSARHPPSAAHRVEIILQTLAQEFIMTNVALSLDEIRKQMPLASADGVLVCHHWLNVDGDIYEVL